MFAHSFLLKANNEIVQLKICVFAVLNKNDFH